MDLRDNEMNRSVTQALYKYLPEAWIDFYVKKTRTMYTARVRSWNSELLTNINGPRLLSKIKSNLVAFEKANGKLDGFGEKDNISIETYDIRTPKIGVNPDIFAEISPLTFYCDECKKVETVRESSDVKKYITPKSKCCNRPLKQIPLLYSCQCGWAGPVTILPCKEHGFKNIKYNGKFGFKCSICNKTIQMIKKCPVCKTRLVPKPALDSSHFIPASLSTIDLINMKEEKLLGEKDETGAKVILGNWLGEISNEDYSNFINNGISREENNDKIDQFNLMVKSFMEMMNMSEEVAIAAAKVAIYGNNNNVLQKNDDYFDINIKTKNINIDSCALNILEYYRVLKGEDDKNYVSTLDDAIRISRELNTSDNPEKLSDISKAFGIKNIQACGNVPFLFCSYGYTRKTNDPKQDKNNKELILKAFPSEGRGKKTVYAVKLNTEGILIEFDKKMILEWMLKNNFIKDIDLPKDLDNEQQLKEWFINNINIDNIPIFSNIDEIEHSNTAHIYKLLHSMSHALIKQAGEISGLDKNSISEYIFPQIPAVFIYCQNSQGLSLGALFNLFEAYFDKWLKYTLNSIEKCIFDPICIDRDRACAGCLYINEISCVHFNKDLDRRYLLGHYDKMAKEKIYGFWENIKWQ